MKSSSYSHCLHFDISLNVMDKPEFVNSKTSKPSVIAGPSSPSLLTWTFNDALQQRCLDHPDDIAVVSQHQAEQYTYRGLQNRSTQLAAGLWSLGVRKGDRVGVLLGNRSEYVDVCRPVQRNFKSCRMLILETDTVRMFKAWSFLHALQLRILAF